MSKMIWKPLFKVQSKQVALDGKAKLEKAGIEAKITTEHGGWFCLWAKQWVDEK